MTKRTYSCGFYDRHSGNEAGNIRIKAYTARDAHQEMARIACGYLHLDLDEVSVRGDEGYCIAKKAGEPIRIIRTTAEEISL